MNQAIVIATTPSSVWLNLIRDSLKSYSKYPLIILSDYTYELGKIKYIYDHTDIDEFVFLHDTCVIKDLSLFDLCFETYQGISVAFSMCPVKFGMYLGKYRRDTLKRVEIPTPYSKIDSVKYEVSFNNAYCQAEPETVLLFNDFHDVPRFEEKNGRNNMVLENQYLKKYKGTWSMEMT
jgi:hypothetical protein